MGGKLPYKNKWSRGEGGHRIQHTTSVQLVQRQEVKDTGVSNFLWPNHACNAYIICCKLDTLKFLLLEEINIVKPLPRAPNFIIFKIYIFPILTLFKANFNSPPNYLNARSTNEIMKWIKFMVRSETAEVNEFWQFLYLKE